jgi:hypothetical protein
MINWNNDEIVDSLPLKGLSFSLESAKSIIIGRHWLRHQEIAK